VLVKDSETDGVHDPHVLQPGGPGAGLYDGFRHGGGSSGWSGIRGISGPPASESAGRLDTEAGSAARLPAV
jgi:hypothetical protein